MVKAFQAAQEAYLEAYTANVDSITETIRRFNDMVNQSKQGNQYDDEDEEDRQQLGGGALAIKKRITNSISKFHKTNKVKRRVKKQTKKNKRRQRK